MRNRTRIIVIKKRDLMLAGLLALLIVGLLALAIHLFGSGKQQAPEAAETMKYTPGVYTSTVILNDTAMDVEVVVDENNINSISLVNLDESVETMYPLVKPAMEDLSEQIITSQSVDNVTYPQTNQYTSMVLHNAVRSALEKSHSDQK